MTKDEFINNLRGVDQGQNINREYLSNIYDNILASPIEMMVESSEVTGKDESKDLKFHKRGSVQSGGAEKSTYGNSDTDALIGTAGVGDEVRSRHFSVTLIC